MKVTVSAPGKLHLMGEHAVVYGKPAILTATSQRLYVNVERLASSVQKSNGQSSLTLRNARKKDVFLNHIVSLVEKKYQSTVGNSYISTTSAIPRGAGMGSSAAFAAATVGALMTYMDKKWDVSVINELAFAAEKKMHGNPSGGDNAIVVHGGLLWYRREFDFFKTFWQLPVSFPKNFAPFILVHTGKPKESTKQMITSVDSRFKNQDLRREKILIQIEKLAKQFLQAVHDEDEKSMQEAMHGNEKLLEQLGVVSKSAKSFIRSVEKSGGVAKISGAGGVKNGSGIIICQHRNPKVITTIAQKDGFEHFQTKFAQPGVKIEQIVQ